METTAVEVLNPATESKSLNITARMAISNLKNAIEGLQGRVQEIEEGQDPDHSSTYYAESVVINEIVAYWGNGFSKQEMAGDLELVAAIRYVLGIK